MRVKNPYKNILGKCETYTEKQRKFAFLLLQEECLKEVKSSIKNFDLFSFHYQFKKDYGNYTLEQLLVCLETYYGYNKQTAVSGIRNMYLMKVQEKEEELDNNDELEIDELEDDLEMDDDDDLVDELEIGDEDINYLLNVLTSIKAKQALVYNSLSKKEALKTALKSLSF